MVYLGDSVIDKLLVGASVVVGAVGVSMGFSGRNVLIREGDSVRSTRDGVTIVRNIRHEGIIEDTGCLALSGVAERQLRDVGDGTSTATVLSYELIVEGLRVIRNGYGGLVLKRGMEVCLREVIGLIEGMSVRLEVEEDIRRVAVISANNSEEIGGLVSRAFMEVGRDGLVSVRESSSFESCVEIVDGLSFDRGYVSGSFVTDRRRGIAELECPLVYMCNRKLSSSRDVYGAMSLAIKAGRSLLVVCMDIEGEALKLVLHNKLSGNIKCCVVQAPYLNRRGEFLGDLASVVGGRVTEDNVVVMEDLGECEKVTISERETVVVGGSRVGVGERVELLEHQAEGSDDEMMRRYYEERLGKLRGRCAVLSIGAATEIELRAKMDAVDDCVRSVRSAFRGGIVSGGGACFLDVLKSRDGLEFSGEERVGADVLFRAIEAPFRRIVENGGYASDVAMYRVMSCGLGYGFDVESGEVVNMYESGIIDSAYGVCKALENAVSCASMFLLTAGVINK